MRAPDADGVDLGARMRPIDSGRRSCSAPPQCSNPAPRSNLGRTPVGLGVCVRGTGAAEKGNRRFPALVLRGVYLPDSTY